MEHIVKKILDSHIKNYEIEDTEFKIQAKDSSGNDFFLYIKEKDTFFFDFDEFSLIKNMLTISDFACSTYIKKYFKEMGITYSIFLPILNSGIYWYDLDCVL